MIVGYMVVPNVDGVKQEPKTETGTLAAEGVGDGVWCGNCGNLTWVKE